MCSVSILINLLFISMRCFSRMLISNVYKSRIVLNSIDTVPLFQNVFEAIKKKWEFSVDSTRWLFHPLFPGRIGIWKLCWFLWREENRSTRRKTLRGGTRTNNKLNPHKTLRPEIKPGPHWWEASALTTAPSLLPNLQCVYWV